MLYYIEAIILILAMYRNLLNSNLKRLKININWPMPKHEKTLKQQTLVEVNPYCFCN